MVFVLVGIVMIVCNLMGWGPIGAWNWEFSGDLWKFVLPFALLILAFYWFFLRPQTTKAREHRDLLAKLKRNDEVVTAGGLLGRINEVGDKVIVLEIAPNVRVRVERSQITALSSYGKPAVTKKAEQ